MKRTISAGLLLALLLSLCPIVHAEEAVTPTPPAWLPEEDYLIFPGDPVYEPETWQQVLELREKASAGTLEYKECMWNNNAGTWNSIGKRYEMGLICLEAGYEYGTRTWFGAARPEWAKEHGQDEIYYQFYLWEYRCKAMDINYTYDKDDIGRLLNILEALDLTLDDFYDAPFMDQVSEGWRARLARDVEAYLARIDIFLDGKQIYVKGEPEIKNNRIMVPLRSVTEGLGADVEWVGDTQQIVITRASNTVMMTLNQTTAYLDGVPVEMDVAPYAINGRTLIPVRYVAELFGQTVTWDGKNRRVDIYEDKSAAGDSNLEAWALPMGAMLNKINDEGPTTFGPVRNASKASSVRNNLASGWGIHSREELITTVLRMTYHGHNASFLSDVVYINSLSPAQYAAYCSSEGMDSYMFPYTKQLSEKWGERGILAWDLFRMSNVVQWGYAAGYLTYEEALALLEPAAALLKETFSSWDEAYENYLDGYNWWDRNNVLDQDIWETNRGERYLAMKENPDIAPIFDDALFTQDIIPVPGVTAQQLLAEAQGS